jgi:maltose alpha-D-glucosyltransferase/alpha-amylase
MQPWYRNAVFYSVSVEAFMDGDGDGVGDFSGLRQRLEYLESLGVDVLWLAPTQPTPNRDDGYDITDYYGIDGRLGSSGGFVEFLSEAEGRGMRVLLDLVVNHTSDRHPWFLSARASSGSPYRDWYVWSRKRPRAARSGVVFPGAQATTWSYDRKARSWYFHRFYDFEPDLNLENDRVREEIHRVVGYWLRLGVSGFRVDAVPFLLEKPRPDGGPATLRFEFLRELRELVQWRRGDAILLGEANVVPRDDQEYFAGGDGLHMMFNFWVNQHLFASLATRDARQLASALAATRNIPRGLNGHTSCGITTSSTSAVCRPAIARLSSLSSPPRPRCSSTAAGYAGGWRRCWETNAVSSSPTACSSRCPGLRCCGTGRRSGWARTCG